MRSHRMLAGFLYACGLLSVLLGLEESTGARTCTEVEHYSSRCKNAWATAPVPNASGSYCEWHQNECQKTAPSSCVHRWGIAYSGDCIPDPIGTTDLYDCFENAFITLVNVRWYVAHCEQDNAECNCEWDESSTSQTVQVCDCYDVPVED